MRRWFSMIVILLLATTAANAQDEPVVKSFRLLETSHIPSNDRRKDYNDDYCALVKVQALDDIDRIEGNSFGSIVNRGVEKWVYMIKGSPKMTIKFKNNLPVEVIYSKYGINRLESNRVYELVISVPHTQQQNQTQPVPKSAKEMEEQKKREEQQFQEQKRREEQQRLEQKKREEQQLLEQKRREEQRLKEEARIKAEADRRAEAEAKERQREQLRKEKAEQAKIRAAQRRKKMEQRAQMPLMFGLRAGYNMATASFSSYKGGSTSSMSGFHLGVTMDARLSQSFYLNTGLIYSAKGYCYKSAHIEEEGNPQYLDIPILGSYRIAIGNSTRLQLNAGPYLALCVAGKVTDKLYNSYDESFSSAYGGFDYGLQVGTALTFSHRYSLGVHYQIGMASSYQNRNLLVGLGIYF